MPRPLTDTGLRMLGELPSVLQGSDDYQAVLHAASREVDRMDATLESVRQQFNPAQADLLLGAWEMMCKLPVGGYGSSLAQRQARVLFRLRKILGSSEGLEWIASITDLIGSSGWTYEEHIPGDPTSPPVNWLKITVPLVLSGSGFAEAFSQIREITPAHLEIELLSSAGFTLDISDLDVTEMVD